MEGDWMLEIAIATAFVAAAIFMMSGRQMQATGGQADVPITMSDDASDLPCPWCRSQTREGDAHCPSCGHRFG
jgi:hypothetical protein